MFSSRRFVSRVELIRFGPVADLTDEDLKCLVSQARKFMLANVTGSLRR